MRTVIRTALAYMEEHYADSISLRSVADYVCLHPVHLSRLFHQQTGRTFQATLTAMRMEKARELLNGTDLKVYEVSRLAGYQKSRYFGELFKENTGLTPMAYRERARG